MSEILEFPGSPSDRLEELHAEAFRDLEHHISDCATMSGIAAELAVNTKGIREDLSFAVCHLSEMLSNLKKAYYAACDGAMPLHFV